MLSKKFWTSAPAPLPPPVDGNMGLFKVNAAAVSAYVYATDVASAGVVPALSSQQSRVLGYGNAEKAIFVGSPAFADRTTTADKFTYATAVTSAAGAWLSHVFGSASASLSISEFATLSFNGSSNQITKRYAFATETVADSSTTTTAQGSSAAASSNTSGILAMGPSSTGSPITNKIVYASSVITLGTNLTNNMTRGGAAGNVEAAFFLNGSTTSVSTTCRYQHANDTTAVGSAASYEANASAVATGNSTRGIFSLRVSSGVTTNRTLRCMYASGVWGAGGFLSGTPDTSQAACMSNGNIGII